MSYAVSNAVIGETEKGKSLQYEERDKRLVKEVERK